MQGAQVAVAHVQLRAAAARDPGYAIAGARNAARPSSSGGSFLRIRSSNLLRRHIIVEVSASGSAEKSPVNVTQ